jgi:hypothetical protein
MNSPYEEFFDRIYRMLFKTYSLILFYFLNYPVDPVNPV